MKGYVGTYLREEIQIEARIRNLELFSQFLEAASFSQGSILSVAVETLILQELRATLANHDLDFQLSFWRSQSGETHLKFERIDVVPIHWALLNWLKILSSNDEV